MRAFFEVALFSGVILVLLRDVLVWVLRSGSRTGLLAVTCVLAAVGGIWYGVNYPKLIGSTAAIYASLIALVVLTLSAFASLLRREGSLSRRYANLFGHLFIYAGFGVAAVGKALNFASPNSVWTVVLFALLAIGFALETVAMLLPSSQAVSNGPSAPRQTETVTADRKISFVTILINGVGLLASILGIVDFILNRLR